MFLLFIHPPLLPVQFMDHHQQFPVPLVKRKPEQLTLLHQRVDIAQIPLDILQLLADTTTNSSPTLPFAFRHGQITLTGNLTIHPGRWHSHHGTSFQDHSFQVFPPIVKQVQVRGIGYLLFGYRSIDQHSSRRLPRLLFACITSSLSTLFFVPWSSPSLFCLFPFCPPLPSSFAAGPFNTPASRKITSFSSPIASFPNRLRIVTSNDASKG